MLGIASNAGNRRPVVLDDDAAADAAIRASRAGFHGNSPPSVRFAERDVDDTVVIGANRECARAAVIGPDGAARFELDRPVVQRTCDAVAEDDALRQRPALVRTAIAQREDAVGGGAEK